MHTDRKSLSFCKIVAVTALIDFEVRHRETPGFNISRLFGIITSKGNLPPEHPLTRTTVIIT